jgi:hypothetical protein
MWTISDFPTYGLISGLCTKGYKACPVCGPKTVAHFAKIGALQDDRTARGSKNKFMAEDGDGYIHGVTLTGETFELTEGRSYGEHP